MRSCKTLKNDHRRFPVPHPAYTSTNLEEGQNYVWESSTKTQKIWFGNDSALCSNHFHDHPLSFHQFLDWWSSIFHAYFPYLFSMFSMHFGMIFLYRYSKGNSDGSHGSPGTIGLVELHRLLIREAGAHCWGGALHGFILVSSGIYTISYYPIHTCHMCCTYNFFIFLDFVFVKSSLYIYIYIYTHVYSRHVYNVPED